MDMTAEPNPDPGPELSSYRVVENGRGNVVAATTEALREAVYDGVLEPGTWLREVVLAQALGVSRTPIREALARLEEEGIVVRESGAGARVVQISLDDMSVVYQVRGSLESLAAKLVAARVTDRLLQPFVLLQEEMRNAAADGDSAAFASANVRFHRQLAVSAGNPYLRRLLSTVEIGIRRFGARTFTPERMQSVLQEHQQIVEAFTNRDPDAASEAAAAHARSARKSTLGHLIADMQ
jgi:GntR family transcriptional regulator, rspAB operon transcriptional repressor